jgi:ribonuclease D
VTRWIRTRDELQELAQSLASCRALALDSESDSLHHHAEKVCLVQLGSDSGVACLIDPLAVGDLTPLAPLIADPAVLKVFHGADYDVTTMKRDFGFTFAGLFDTMIAARFIGAKEIGLQALARAELGVEISKDSQKDDWSRRPLTPKQEAYALADVQYLLALRERLTERLRALGRLSWVEEECEAVAALEPARRGRDPEAYLRVKGVSRLPRRQQAVFRGLFEWREALAAKTDIPAFKLIGSESLLAIAERLPRTAVELAEVKGLSARIRSQPAAPLEAIERALALSEDELPRSVAPRKPLVPDAVRRRIDALKAWRNREAVALGLDPSVILPQRLVEKVAEAGPRRVLDLSAIPGLRRWRVEALGAGMIAATARS